MKSFFIALLLSLTYTSAYASNYSGKCSDQALDAAIAKWANVPEPSDTLEYLPVSSKPMAPRSTTYTVVLAFSDGNDIFFGDYKVEFESLKDCSKPVVTNSKN